MSPRKVTVTYFRPTSFSFATIPAEVSNDESNMEDLHNDGEECDNLYHRNAVTMHLSQMMRRYS